MGTDRKHSALTVRILGHNYPVSCPENEREALLESAEYLSQRMNTIQRQNKTRGTDRIAILAALNITRDLLDLKRQIESNGPTSNEQNTETGERLSQLQLHIQSALGSSNNQD